MRTKSRARSKRRTGTPLTSCAARGKKRPIGAVPGVRSAFKWPASLPNHPALAAGSGPLARGQGRRSGNLPCSLIAIHSRFAEQSPTVVLTGFRAIPGPGEVASASRIVASSRETTRALSAHAERRFLAPIRVNIYFTLVSMGIRIGSRLQLNVGWQGRRITTSLSMSTQVSHFLHAEFSLRA